MISLAKDFLVGVIILGVLLVIWSIVVETGRQLVALLPIGWEWFEGSWTRTLLGLTVLLVFVLLLGRGSQAVFGRRLATIPGFRRLVRSGKLVITELSPTQSRGFNVVLVKLTPEENRRVAILSSILEDPETGRKLAAVFIPGTPNVRAGDTCVLPLDEVTMTNWSVSDATTFLMSGGTVSPNKLHFDNNAPG